MAIQWYLLFLAVFFAVNTVLLRMSCRLVNCASLWSTACTPLQLPSYRTCLAIVFGAVVIFGLLAWAAEVLIASWAEHLFDRQLWKILTTTIELVVLVKLLAWGLSDEQPRPTRLVTAASITHIVLFVGLCFSLGLIVTGLK